MTSGGRARFTVATAAHAAAAVVVIAVVACLGASCARRTAPPLAALAPLALPAAESTRTDTVAPGVVHRQLRIARGPWAIHILDVDRAACWSVAALKAGGRAVGGSALPRWCARSRAARGRSWRAA